MITIVKPTTAWHMDAFLSTLKTEWFSSLPSFDKLWPCEGRGPNKLIKTLLQNICAGLYSRPYADYKLELLD